MLWLISTTLLTAKTRKNRDTFVTDPFYRKEIPIMISCFNRIIVIDLTFLLLFSAQILVFAFDSPDILSYKYYYSANCRKPSS